MKSGRRLLVECLTEDVSAGVRGVVVLSGMIAVERKIQSAFRMAECACIFLATGGFQGLANVVGSGGMSDPVLNRTDQKPCLNEG